MEGLSAWHLWAIAGLILAVLEIKLSGFVTLWFSVGALLAALLAAVGVGPEIQLLVFSAVSLALFAASRTIFQRFFMRTASTMKEGSDAMIGATAQVTEALPEAGYGAVRINGELWTARSLSGALRVGDWVRVEQLDGLKLLVRLDESLSSASSSFPRKEPAS